ncbi:MULTISPECIES: response regulator [unclassified Actinomyces]|uniref:response regulator n=1 Tax=unclassified Actinomyces TaxID=2609248 RepID=UPI0020171C81|nr:MULTISPECIES: response regulator [unclassified Actinomyces]MCL3777331.1 response regulator [Actinomyces sp. AC-20-1]MCL3789645.1 response regulator [Actinomyces sp. 187325]MCL3792190.1 response regulator [Actinomyces sp. 186855]MCL3794822.1 response regulator [Actinomyces sp. 217892]
MKLTILVVDDEPEVRDAVVGDLLPFADVVRVEPAEDVEDAWEVVEEVEDDGDVIALVLADHRMPGTTGVDMLIAMEEDERTADARKVLVTGQADQADTIRAVNEAGLDHYVAKPWRPEDLQAVVREQLTDFVVATGLDPLPHLRAIDGARAMEMLR